LGVTLTVKFYIVFSEVVATIYEEMFRRVYSNLLLKFDGGPRAEEYFHY